MTRLHHASPMLLAVLAVLAVLALPAHGAGAGPLADPTRPPAALAAPGTYTPAPAGPHRSNLDTARAIAAAARNANPPPPVAAIALQSVQVRANGTALAMVDGRLVKVGDQIDGRSVLAIDHQGLLLKGSSGPERVWLLAGSPKQAAGSITDSRSAHYQSVATPADTLVSLNPNPNATPAPLSLAGKTTP